MNICYMQKIKCKGEKIKKIIYLRKNTIKNDVDVVIVNEKKSGRCS